MEEVGDILVELSDGSLKVIISSPLPLNPTIPWIAGYGVVEVVDFEDLEEVEVVVEKGGGGGVTK